MDSMDRLQERVEVLEHQTHTIERRLRWWPGIVGDLLVLGLLSWAQLSGKAADAPAGGMAEPVATLEKKLRALAFNDAANVVKSSRSCLQ
jgi:hypothetical protein